MFRMVWGQLRGRAGRSVALLVGVLVATTGFVVLTGATTTSRLEVTGAVERETRSAYDILVRPTGARTALEAEHRLVRPNYLSGIYGGITLQQYERVRAVAGVEVAAPIAMLGHSTSRVPMSVDLTDAVDRSLDRQVIRIDRTYVAERGLSTAPGRPEYVYVTRYPLIYPVIEPDTMDSARYTDGRVHSWSDECGAVPREVQPDGSSRPVCDPRSAVVVGNPGWSEREIWRVLTARLLPDGRFEVTHRALGAAVGAVDPGPTTVSRLALEETLTVPFLIAAVDPDAEQRLVGLADAVVDGRPLNAADTLTDTSIPGFVPDRSVPALVPSRPFLDGAVRTRLTRLPTARPAGLPPTVLDGALRRAEGTPAGSAEIDLAESYRGMLAAGLGDDAFDSCCRGQLQVLAQPGPVDYERGADGTLRIARVSPPDPAVFGDRTEINLLPRPWLSDDTGSRRVGRLVIPSDEALHDWRAVGVFDPDRLTGFGELSKVPLETYEPPRAEGADDRSRAALGGRPLEPSGNPAGYLSAPPLVLTNLASVPKLLEGGNSPQRGAPISAIRVRVAGVDGYNEAAAERVRLIAEQINRATGLDVDITLGSSPAPQTVTLPAGEFGRPELRLTENWSALGVASTIVEAVDRKSAVLFLLVLVVCGLFLGNAVSAAVRDRRPELAVLACLGWPARRIAALILGEVALLGLVAGLLAIGLTGPLGAALGIDVDWRRALLAVPVALLLALVAGLTPALRAARAHPAAALRPPVATAGWVRRPRTLLSLALVNLVRTPGRTLLGAGALAIGVAALTVVAAVSYAFHGAIVGNLLGDTVALTVRGADALAAAATVLLGAAAVADVLYLNIRDRATELAALRATGWTDLELGRLIGYEGLLLGTLGALTGAALGMTGAAWLVGDLPGALILVAGLTAASGVLLTATAALAPATLLRRLPTARLLAEE
ncbi:FtsX-like permease family protein [Micromonospora echinaurantiaca]|uniref:FtsX-like permease family protein n=1 Tax=Micromonospora echinaurantiaca TaxID=47857 RepID=A0A1C5GN23_9ACTN|nr:FtsX-like permease family protein [Micromonospora echinaurantiaca]SCG35204.1 FtsX-like permease family protein [Micromonospora echinaurantiaca]